MEILSHDSLVETLSQLNISVIAELAVMSRSLNVSLKEVYMDNLFWKKKTEWLLRRELRNRTIGWEKVFVLASKSVCIIKTADNGNVELLDILIEIGEDPSTKNNAAIRQASENGHLLVVNRLLEDPRVDPSAIRR